MYGTFLIRIYFLFSLIENEEVLYNDVCIIYNKIRRRNSLYKKEIVSIQKGSVISIR